MAKMKISKSTVIDLAVKAVGLAGLVLTWVQYKNDVEEMKNEIKGEIYDEMSKVRNHETEENYDE